MEDYRDFLFSKAFRIVHGTDYNQVSYEMREENQDNLFSFYEIVLQEDESWEQMKERVYPSLVRYLKYKGFPTGSAAGCIVSLYSKDYFYLIEGSDFLDAFCTLEGLTSADFHSRVSEWLSQGPL